MHFYILLNQTLNLKKHIKNIKEEYPHNRKYMHPDYSIELFDSKKHNTNEFSCGSEKLDKYIKEQAGQESRKKVTVIYIIHEAQSPKIIGFYTISACSVDATLLPQNIAKKLPKYKAL